MKKGSKYCYIVTIIGLILGLIVFYLLSIGYMCTPAYSPFFITSISVGIIALLGILIATLISRKSNALKEAFCFCGNFAVIGGIGTVLVSFLTSLISYCCYPAYFFGVAITIFFLTLLLGGIWCLLFSYFNCGRKYVCEKTCTYENDDQQEDIND